MMIEGENELKILNFRKLLGIGLIFSFSMALFVGMYALTLPNSDAPQAKRGVLDLSGWDFRRMEVNQ